MPRPLDPTIIAKRESTILKACEEGKTISELAELTHTSYGTAYRTVRSLMDKGMLVESPFPREGSLVYIPANSDLIETPRLTVWRKNAPEPDYIEQVLLAFSTAERPNKYLKEVAGLFAHLYIRASELDTSMVKIDPTPAEARERLHFYREFFQNIVNIMDQLLVRDIIFLDDPKTMLEMMPQMSDAFGSYHNLLLMAAEWREAVASED